MRLNKLTVIAYALAIAAFSALSVIYEQPALLLFIFVLTLIIPVSIIIFSIVSKKIEFFFYSKTPYVEEPNKPVFIFEYQNSAPVGLFTCDIEFTVQNAFFPNNDEHKVTVSLSRKSNKFFIPIEADEIGLIQVNVKKVVLYDYLSFLKKEIPFDQMISIPILPKERNIGDFPPAVPKDGSDEFVESDNTGNISSDIKEIREYRPGDRLQRIHWKLSAKLDDLFVKEMAHTSTLAIVLLPELTKSEIHDTSSTLLSCIKRMTEKRERFELCIYNDKLCDFSYFYVTNDDEIIEAMTHFYCQPLYSGTNNALEAFVRSSQKEATIIHIHGKAIDIGE